MNEEKYVNWIHPINVCIDGNRIMKNGNDTNWNAAAFSEQYLNFGDDGSIEIEIPGFDDSGQETCDWTQVFFIGFSDGSLNPELTKNILGVRFQQLPNDEKYKSYVMAFSVFVNELHIFTKKLRTN